MSKIEYRTGTHNPYTLYVTGETELAYGGRSLPGWMKEGEWFLGSLPDERLTALAVEAMNAFACRACPWGCTSCTLNRSTCECYDHEEPEQPSGGTLSDGRTYTAQEGALVSALVITNLTSTYRPGVSEERPRHDIAVDLLAALAANGWRLIHD